MDTTKLVDAAADDDPTTGLRAVRALRRLCEQLEAAQVRRARDHGWSWQEIAEVLQVSKQAVHRKYRKQ
jgi:DNA-directed RNA polymerase specialized sigma24 family protein